MVHFRERVEDDFKSIQDDICRDLEVLDGEGRFREDVWHRELGGGGRTRILEGQIIEKGGVNFSAVHGEVTDNMAKSLLIEGSQFFATGVSIVLHPISPMTPIIHMNIRYFEMDDGKIWWFGGGIDLTPHYIEDALAARFHRQLKDVCDRYDTTYYPRFKTWADDYFYLPHREETRGVGGIFFDHLGKRGEVDRHSIFDYVKAVGQAFIPIYSEQVEYTRDIEFHDGHKEWQLHRRGRYAEFNLVWDRGTKFGLHSNGRTESILMSLPPTCRWTYAHQVSEDSREQDTLNKLRKGVDWIGKT